MRSLKQLVIAGVLVTTGTAVGAVFSEAAQAASSPASVTCYTPVTGPQGWTGPQGATGPTGPQGDTGLLPPQGPARGAHVRGNGYPNCVDLVGVCLLDTQYGAPGAVGPTGPTGPKGDTGITIAVGGKSRIVHARQVNPCEGVPRECTYQVRGQQGVQGPAGETGAKGATGVASGIPGPARTAHARPAGSDWPVGGSPITLSACNLPTTGGGSTPALPYALGLIVLGGAALIVADRRRTLRRVG